MPETTIQDKWVDMVPKGFKLPPELTNPDATPEKPAEPQPEAAPPTTKEDSDAKAKQEAVEPTAERPDATSAEDGRAKKEQDWRDRRMYRAQRRAAEAQARAELQEKETARLRAEIEAMRSPKAPTEAPRAENFSDIEDFRKAVAAYERTQAVKEYEEKQKSVQIEEQKRKGEELWQNFISQGPDKYQDWDDVVGEVVPTNEPKDQWLIAAFHSPNGVDVLHYLGKNPKQVEKLQRMNPQQQYLEIGRISYIIQQPVEKPKAPSAAPKPITPVTPESKPSGDEIRPNQPYEEYRKLGNKMFGRGRRL